jgi:hypothetical protein
VERLKLRVKFDPNCVNFEEGRVGQPARGARLVVERTARGELHLEFTRPDGFPAWDSGEYDLGQLDFFVRPDAPLGVTDLWIIDPPEVKWSGAVRSFGKVDGLVIIG